MTSKTECETEAREKEGEIVQRGAKYTVIVMTEN